MSRTLGAAAAAALALALPVHADEPPGDRPVVVADRVFKLPEVPPIRRKAKKDCCMGWRIGWTRRGPDLRDTPWWSLPARER